MTADDIQAISSAMVRVTPQVRTLRFPTPMPVETLDQYRSTIKRGRILLVPLLTIRTHLPGLLALLEGPEGGRGQMLTVKDGEWIVTLLRARYGWPDGGSHLDAVSLHSDYPGMMLVRCWDPSWPSVGEGEPFPKFAPVGPLDRIEPIMETA